MKSGFVKVSSAQWFDATFSIVLLTPCSCIVAGDGTELDSLGTLSACYMLILVLPHMFYLQLFLLKMTNM